jgi:hypothetical protein
MIKANKELNMSIEKNAAREDIQRLYRQDGQTPALKLAFLKYGHMGSEEYCCGCETGTLFIEGNCCLCNAPSVTEKEVPPPPVEPPTWDVDDTVGATFHLMGSFEVPRVAVPITVADGSVVGFTLPNGKAYKIQVTIEECDENEDNYRDLNTCELEALGVVGFGELDERDIRIEDEEG